MIKNLWKNAQQSNQPRADAASGTSTSFEGALDAIVKLIPVEVIGVYLALVGLFGQSWGIFWIGSALIPILLLIAHFEKSGEKPKPSVGKLILVVLFAFVAYVPWAATLPETPFTEFHENANKYAAGTAIVLSAFLPRLARLLGIAP